MFTKASIEESRTTLDIKALVKNSFLYFSFSFYSASLRTSKPNFLGAFSKVSERISSILHLSATQII